MIDMQGGLELALGGNGARPFKYKIGVTFPSALKLNGFSSQSRLNTLCKSTNIPGARITQKEFWDNGHLYKLPSTKTYDTEWTGTFYLDDSYTIRVLFEKWLSYIDFYNGQYYGDLSSSDEASKIMDVADKLIGKAPNVAKDIVKDSTEYLNSMMSTTRFSGLSDNINTVTNSILSSDIVGDIDRAVQKFVAGSSTPIQGTPDIYGDIIITQLDILGGEIVKYHLYKAYPISLSHIQFDDMKTDSINEFSCTFSFSHYEIETEDLISSTIGQVKSTLGY